MTERTDGAKELGGGIEDLERRLAALEGQMRIVRTVMVPALVTALERTEELLRILGKEGARCHTRSLH
jgi:hypothetical protein